MSSEKMKMIGYIISLSLYDFLWAAPKFLHEKYSGSWALLIRMPQAEGFQKEP